MFFLQKHDIYISEIYVNIILDIGQYKSYITFPYGSLSAFMFLYVFSFVHIHR